MQSIPEFILEASAAEPILFSLRVVTNFQPSCHKVSLWTLLFWIATGSFSVRGQG